MTPEPLFSVDKVTGREPLVGTVAEVRLELLPVPEFLLGLLEGDELKVTEEAPQGPVTVTSLPSDAEETLVQRLFDEVMPSVGTGLLVVSEADVLKPSQGTVTILTFPSERVFTEVQVLTGVPVEPELMDVAELGPDPLTETVLEVGVDSPPEEPDEPVAVTSMELVAEQGMVTGTVMILEFSETTTVET